MVGLLRCTLSGSWGGGSRRLEVCSLLCSPERLVVGDRCESDRNEKLSWSLGMKSRNHLQVETSERPDAVARQHWHRHIDVVKSRSQTTAIPMSSVERIMYV